MITHSRDRGHANVVHLLLQSGATIDLQNNDGASALLFASYWGRAEVVHLLIDHGANPELADKQGATALELTEGDPVSDSIGLGAWAHACEHEFPAQSRTSLYLTLE